MNYVLIVIQSIQSIKMDIFQFNILTNSFIIKKRLNRMGNKTGGSQQIQRAYPYFITRKELNVQVKLEGVKFEQSPYNIQTQKFVVKPAMDKQIRNSQFCYVSMSALSDASKPLIVNYLKGLRGFDSQYDMVNDQWRLTRYLQNGHFVQHFDRQKQLNDHKHFGTQIFLPPKSQSNYKGGQLKLFYNGKTQQIIPDQKLWTHIILPLGIQHLVQKVKNGTRISYVKQIWVKQIQEPIETDQDRERKNVQQRRRGGRIIQRGYLD